MTKEEEILLSKAREFIRKDVFSKKTSDFFPEHIIYKIIKDVEENNILLYKFNEFGEYSVLVSKPDYIQDSNPGVFLIKGKLLEEGIINHRMILGSLMGLGIKREKIGDIFITERSFYIYVHETIVEYVLINLLRVGKYPIEFILLRNLKTAFKPRTKSITINSSSDRIDNIISKVFSFSREKSKELVESNLVKINGLIVGKAQAEVTSGDKISVRGSGKFYISDEEKTKNGYLYKIEIFY
jgi:RNA-binding protein YlmH